VSIDLEGVLKVQLTNRWELIRNSRAQLIIGSIFLFSFLAIFIIVFPPNLWIVNIIGFFSSFTNTLALLLAIGYVGLFVIVFAETGLFFGFFLPGDSLLLAAGILSSQNLFNVFGIMVVVILAAIIGDNFGYWFGRKVGPMFIKRESRFLNAQRVESVRVLFEKHGSKAIVFARFVPIARTFAPILAGASKMKGSSFFCYNVVGALLWGITMPMLGYTLGKVIPDIQQYIYPIIALIIVVSVLPWLIKPISKIARSFLSGKKKPSNVSFAFAANSSRIISSAELGQERKTQSRSKRILKIAIQIIAMAAIFGVLLWYVGVGSLYDALLNIKVEYLFLAFLMYFGINVLFTVRLRRVLAKDGVKTSFGKTLLAQYAGMLTSDVTPGRSGYILTPVYLRDQNVPTSKGLSSILGIQTIEFLFKVIGGLGAVIFLVKTVPTQTWNMLFPQSVAGINIGILIAGLGIILMLVGAIVLAAFTWSKRAITLFSRIANSKYLKRVTGGLIGKLEEYKESSHSTRRAIPEIIGLTVICWILKGFEWYFLGLALGITNVPLIAYFLIHPLVTALAFVPITPAGAGVQEFGIIGVLGLLGVAVGPAGVFALLARGLLIIEDLIGIPQIVKSTSNIFSSKPVLDNQLKNG
jgi:membrane-associated protein